MSSTIPKPQSDSRSTELARQSPPSLEESVLLALGLNPRDPKVRALALVAERYNLDLLLHHVFLIQGTVYVSHAGLLHLAHMSGDLDGIEVEITEEEKKWIATARVYRKSMSRPFTYTDECGKSERVQSPRKRAITRAERNALRRAFDVGVDVYEDDVPSPNVKLSDTRPSLPAEGEPSAPGLEAPRVPPVPESPSAGPSMEPWKSVVIRCREMGLTDDERHKLVRNVTNGRSESAKDLSPKEAAEAHRLLEMRSAWRTSPQKTATSSNPPSSKNPAPTDTSSTGPPAGDGAEGVTP